MTEKYRAKRKDCGVWAAGVYVPREIKGTTLHFIQYAINQNGERAYCKASIDPDTLSRCSGLTACGQDVYEGDIIRLHINHTTEFWTAVVRFGWHDTHEYGWYLDPIRDTVFTKRIGAWLGENAAFGTTTVAVIGNVWDNPELMGVQT